MCVRERERERERVCVCVCERECVSEGSFTLSRLYGYNPLNKLLFFMLLRELTANYTQQSFGNDVQINA